MCAIQREEPRGDSKKGRKRYLNFIWLFDNWTMFGKGYRIRRQHSDFTYKFLCPKNWIFVVALISIEFNETQDLGHTALGLNIIGIH